MPSESTPHNPPDAPGAGPADDQSTGVTDDEGRPPGPGTPTDRVTRPPGDGETQWGDVVGDGETEPGDVIGDAQEAIEQARRRLADAPAEVVVTNHVMGLYELAAIHLSSATPNLPSAALAIDAVACLVDGLGDRLGPDVAALRDALANIRLAFVQIKTAAAKQSPGSTPETDAPS